MKVSLSTAEWILFAAVYAGLSVLAAWLFYDCPAASPTAVLFLPVFIRSAKEFKTGRYREEMTNEFIRALISVSTSLSAGISPENAFMNAESDMEKLYGKGSPVCRELGMINTRVNMGMRIQDALYDMAKRNGIDEIYDFATVFAVAMEKGASFPNVISSCVSIMESRRWAECEAKVLIRAKQYEQRIMCVIPPGILAYLRISSGSFTEVLYHNIAGAVIMTACLAVYILAIFLAERIGDIRV